MSPSRADHPLPRSHLGSGPSPGPHPPGSGELEATATKAPRWTWGGPAGSAVPGSPGQTPARPRVPSMPPPCPGPAGQPTFQAVGVVPALAAGVPTGLQTGRPAGEVEPFALALGVVVVAEQSCGRRVSSGPGVRPGGPKAEGCSWKGSPGPPPHPDPCSEDMSLLCAPECSHGGCGPRRPVGKRGQVASFLGTPAPCAQALGQEGSSADSLPPLLLSAPLS